MNYLPVSFQEDTILQHLQFCGGPLYPLTVVNISDHKPGHSLIVNAGIPLFTRGARNPGGERAPHVYIVRYCGGNKHTYCFIFNPL